MERGNLISRPHASHDLTFFGINVGLHKNYRISLLSGTRVEQFRLTESLRTSGYPTTAAAFKDTTKETSCTWECCAVGQRRFTGDQCRWTNGILCSFTTHCSLRLIVRSELKVPTFTTRRLHACRHAKAPSGGRWNCGREISGNFA